MIVLDAALLLLTGAAIGMAVAAAIIVGVYAYKARAKDDE